MNHAAPPPLAVDLDGTLVLGDTLHESLLVLLRRNPLYLFLLPLWLLGGKAGFKREIARRAIPDPADLAYNQPLLEWLREQCGQRPIVLCSAADAGVADAVAGYVGLFDEVIASDGTRNLAGATKADVLAMRFGDKGFDYAGNSHVDIAVWQRARRAIVVNASPSTERSAQLGGNVAKMIPGAPGNVWTWMRALRLHQWVKNLLVFLPLLGAHLFFDSQAIWQTTLAFLAFSLCASAVYLINDLIDLPADRSHPRKRHRPFAAGHLPIAAGLALVPALLLAALLLALCLPERFALVLAGYFLLTLAYTFRLKRVEIVDVIVLAMLYTARIIAGAVAIPVAASFWLLAFIMFLFLSLALIKRYTELVVARDSGREEAFGRTYRIDDLPLIGALGIAAGYLSVLVLALYVNNSGESTELYAQPKMLWLLCPMLLYWISRAWMLTHRGRMHDDPLLFAVRDPVSLVILLLTAAVAWAAL